MNKSFLGYYRCPEKFADFALTGEPSEKTGFFHFGEGVLCHGSTASGLLGQEIRGLLYDALA